MDTLAFVIALLAFLAVGWWYFENEEKKAGGGFGAMALRLPGDAAADDAKVGEEAASDGPRYRARTRVAPVRAERMRAAPDVEAYRAKDAEAPAYKKRQRFGETPLEDL